MAFNYYTIIIGFVIGFILFFKFPTLKKGTEQMNQKMKVSVIIPARNEAHNLPAILGDLKKQSYHIHEIICIDDNSKDATAQIIKEHNAKCIMLNGLPQNWKGKPWACQKGAQAATGEILVFLDADVRLSEYAIESLLQRFQKTGKPISIQPFHTVKKQHEYFSLFFNLIKICATAMSIIYIKKTYGLYGPVFIIPKQLFDKYRGFEVVKNNVAEDLNLGRFYNKQGIAIDLFLGAALIHFRMYPKSFKDLFEGWTKNFSRGSISIRWWILSLVFIWIASLNAIPLEIIYNIIDFDCTNLIILLGIHMLVAAMIYRAAKHAGSYPFYVCLLYPIYLLAFEIIFLYSIIATFLLKSTTWKGRRL